MTNPLLEVYELPPFQGIKAEHVEPAMARLLEKNKSVIEGLLKTAPKTWDGLIAAIEQIDDGLSQAFSPVSHLNGVLNSAELREAYNNVVPKLTQYHTDMGQNADLFQAYEKITQSDDYKDLHQAQKQTLRNAIRDFKLSGIDLPADQQERYGEISAELSDLSNKFNNNVLDATMAWQKVIQDLAELSGLPDSALAQAKQMAEEKALQGYLFTLDFPSYFPVMTYCENQALRREMYEAFSTRASEKGPNAGEFDNSDNIQQMLKLRTELAQLLGFKNYAEKSLATKMAQSPDQVMTFLNDMALEVKPAAEKEFAELRKFAETEYGVTELNPWDVGFYSEKLKAFKYDISDESLRPYFPAPTVLSGMFEVVRRLYDIEVSETTTMETWHDDVLTFEIKKDGAVIARFYLDLYARANKRGGAWMDDCRVRRVRADGSLQLPVAYLTCNFTGPVGDDPALLTHNEVVTLFHEFGHGLHHMLTKVSYAPVSGINGVAWDAVELPSQFMENWCWQEQALEFISGHYQTGETLPKSMLDKMLAAKNFQTAMMTVRQLEFSLFDFRLHMEFDPEADNQLQHLLDEVRSDVAVIPAADFNRFQNSFGHIFGGGYAAGYYSYKWAEVLSADAFEKFQEDGIFNRQTGEKFLQAVLEQGGTRDAMDLFVAFRGRKPSIDALLKQDGLR